MSAIDSKSWAQSPHIEDSVQIDSHHALHTVVLGQPRKGEQPVVIAFHGSGDSVNSWLEAAQQVSPFTRILLYDRSGYGKSTGSEHQSARTSVEDLNRLLSTIKLGPPYILVAHSYGGLIAREFLQQRSRDVVGMVLAETGQETVSEHEQDQYKRQILKMHPLSVIRGQSLIGRRKQLERDKTVGKKSSRQLKREEAVLEQWDREDERLKKEQLKLSKNYRYVYLEDCGHHVVRDRPEVVAEEIRWVLDHAADGTDEQLLPEIPRLLSPTFAFVGFWRFWRREGR